LSERLLYYALIKEDTMELVRYNRILSLMSVITDVRGKQIVNAIKRFADAEPELYERMYSLLPSPSKTSSVTPSIPPTKRPAELTLIRQSSRKRLRTSHDPSFRLPRRSLTHSVLSPAVNATPKIDGSIQTPPSQITQSDPNVAHHCAQNALPNPEVLPEKVEVPPEKVQLSPE
jgi:hypothetical protein